jgi:hypothetical protein
MIRHLAYKVIVHKNLKLDKPIKTNLLVDDKIKTLLDIHQNFSYYDLVNIHGLLDARWSSQVNDQLLERYLSLGVIEYKDNKIRLTPHALKISIEYLILYGMIKTCADITLTTYIENQINGNAGKVNGLNKKAMLQFLNLMDLVYDESYGDEFYVDLITNIVSSLHTPYRPLASKMRLGNNQLIEALYLYNRLRFWVPSSNIKTDLVTQLLLNGMLDYKNSNGLDLFRFNCSGQAFVTHKYALKIHNTIYGRQKVEVPIFFVYEHVLFS